MTIKTILFAGAMTLGLAACHHDQATNTAANTTYAQQTGTNHKTGARQSGTFNHSKNSVPSASNGTNVNTDSDMDRTGNSGTTKQGNPGTADLPDR